MNDHALYYHAETMRRYIEALGMYSENQQRLANGESIMYGQDSFYNLINAPY